MTASSAGGDTLDTASKAGFANHQDDPGRGTPSTAAPTPTAVGPRSSQGASPTPGDTQDHPSAKPSVQQVPAQRVVATPSPPPARIGSNSGIVRPRPVPAKWPKAQGGGPPTTAGPVEGGPATATSSSAAVAVAAAGATPATAPGPGGPSQGPPQGQAGGGARRGGQGAGGQAANRGKAEDPQIRRDSEDSANGPVRVGSASPEIGEGADLFQATNSKKGLAQTLPVRPGSALPQPDEESSAASGSFQDDAKSASPLTSRSRPQPPKDPPHSARPPSRGRPHGVAGSTAATRAASGAPLTSSKEASGAGVGGGGTENPAAAPEKPIHHVRTNRRSAAKSDCSDEELEQEEKDDEGDDPQHEKTSAVAIVAEPQKDMDLKERTALPLRSAPVRQITNEEPDASSRPSSRPSSGASPRPGSGPRPGAQSRPATVNQNANEDSESQTLALAETHSNFPRAASSRPPAERPLGSRKSQEARLSKSVEPPFPKDETLVDVAKRLTKALLLYYRRQPVKTGEVSWSRFFGDLDQEGTGQLTFASFEAAVRDKLRAKVSRYELRVFWRRVDANQSGSATLTEWTKLMYLIELGTWPDLDFEELTRAVKVMSDAAEKWHHAGGNWFRIFAAIDTDESGTLSYAELRNCIRSPFPGLRLTAAELPERTIQGMWKKLDSEGEIEIPVSKFMSFIRKHGAVEPTVRMTEQSKRRRGLNKMRSELPEAPDRSNDELRAIIANLEKGLNGYFASKGFHNNGSSEGNWSRFFRESDADGSGRLNYVEFANSLFRKLGKWLSISQEDVRALWNLLDQDMSMEVTQREMMLAIYRLEVETWPEIEDGDIEKTITKLNAALKRRMNAEGNWYKAFNLVDTEGTGRLKFHDLRDLVRDTFRGLAINTKKLPDSVLKAFWKRLDSDLSGDVTMATFMNFVRKHAGQKNSMHRLTEYSKKRRGIEDKKEERDYSQEIAIAPSYDKETLAAIASRLTLAIHDWVVSSCLRVDSTNPNLWPRFIDEIEKERPSRVTFNEVFKGLQKILHVVSENNEDFSKDGDPRARVSQAQVMAFWRETEKFCGGEVTSQGIDNAIYRLQLQTWPVLAAPELQRIVEAMNNAADKWHRSSGNWYKVFVACDSDGSGTLTCQELFDVVRKGYPSLSIPPRIISDDALRGLWRAVDKSQTGLIDAKEFMSFMRLHGAQLSMHKLTAYSQKLRGMSPVVSNQPAVDPAPPRSQEDIQSISRRLVQELSKYFHKRRGTVLSDQELWALFFSEADHKKNGRLTFFQLESHLKLTLCRPSSKQAALASGSSTMMTTANSTGPADSDALTLAQNELPTSAAEELVTRTIRRGDLLAVWHAIAGELGVSEVSANDWRVGLYRLELDSWPDASDDEIMMVVRKISIQADKWYRAGGNWYKIFKLVQGANASDMIGHRDFFDIIRRPLPSLAMTDKQLSDRELKGLWKALDLDRSGDVDVPEFMCFMRRWEVKWGVSHSPKAAEGSIVHRARMQAAATESGKAARLSDEAMAILSRNVASISDSALREAYDSWGLPWDGYISEWDFLRVVRELGGLGEDILDDDEVHAAWCHMAGSSSGKVFKNALLMLGYA